MVVVVLVVMVVVDVVEAVPARIFRFFVVPTAKNILQSCLMSLLVLDLVLSVPHPFIFIC